MPKSPWKCFICDEEAVGWEADYTFEDYGIPDRDGIVQTYTCHNCGADYEVYIPFPEEDEVGQDLEEEKK